MVRKPISEMDDDEESADAEDAIAPADFEAFSAEDRAEANELFQFLLENGWITHGAYSLDSVPGPDGETRTSVSLNVFLPSSLNVDPQEFIDE